MSSRHQSRLRGKCYLNSNSHNRGDFLEINTEMMPELPSLFVERCRYFQKIIEKLMIDCNDEKLIIYISLNLNSGINELPSYGSNVISIVVGDEWYRVPKYHGRVKAIFKCQGFGPTYLLQGLSAKRKLSMINLMVTVPGI